MKFSFTTTSPAWIKQIFEGSKIACMGGPDYRRISSIRKFSSEVAVQAEAKRRGWIIQRIGLYWQFNADWVATHPIP